jgi:hypothetical protein
MMKYILKCGKVHEVSDAHEETGVAPLLYPVELAKKYLVEKYRHEGRPVPKECAECTKGNKFTYPATFVRRKTPADLVEVPAEVTVCYAVLDPEYRRLREQVLEELISARKFQLGDNNKEEEFDEVLRFLAEMSEKHSRYVPDEAYCGDGYEPTLEVDGVLYPSSESDIKMMFRYNIREEVYNQLAESAGQVYDEEVMWFYFRTKEDCQRFIDLVNSLAVLE